MIDRAEYIQFMRMVGIDADRAAVIGLDDRVRGEQCVPVRTIFGIAPVAYQETKPHRH